VVKEQVPRPNKLSPRWSEPYQIINRFNNGRDYVIIRVSAKDQLIAKANSEVVNIQHLHLIPATVKGSVALPKTKKKRKTAAQRHRDSSAADVATEQIDTEPVPLIHPDHMEHLSSRMARSLIPYDPTTMRRSERSNKGVIERSPHFVDSQLVETNDDVISDTDYA